MKIEVTPLPADKLAEMLIESQYQALIATLERRHAHDPEWPGVRLQNPPHDWAFALSCHRCGVTYLVRPGAAGPEVATTKWPAHD